MTYLADLSAGVVTYNAQVLVRFLFMTHPFNYSGSYKAPLDDLLSSGMKKDGDKLVVAGCTATVVSVAGNEVTVLAIMDSQTGTGTAILDGSAQYLKLVSACIVANVPIMGTLQISLIESLTLNFRRPNGILAKLFSALFLPQD